MHYLNSCSVDDRLVDEIWERVSKSGSFYSIGDGVSKKTFRRVLFESNLVLTGENFLLRLEFHDDYVEVHPIVFGHSFFRNAKDIAEELSSIADRLFAKKRIWIIIPYEMKGAKHLARIAGFTQISLVYRDLSGVSISCSVFQRRIT